MNTLPRGCGVRGIGEGSFWDAPASGRCVANLVIVTVKSPLEVPSRAWMKHECRHGGKTWHTAWRLWPRSWRGWSESPPCVGMGRRLRPGRRGEPGPAQFKPAPFQFAQVKGSLEIAWNGPEWSRSGRDPLKRVPKLRLGRSWISPHTTSGPSKYPG